jgi:hypothetical protein
VWHITVDAYRDMHTIPFFIKINVAEIAMITAIAPNSTPSTLPRIIPALVLDPFWLWVSVLCSKKSNNIRGLCSN